MPTRLTSRLSLLFLVFAMMLAFPAMAFAQDAGAPTIQSDQPDYPPGATVTLTGSNWQPGESVHITVNDDQGQTWSRDVDVNADANGQIQGQFQLPSTFVALYKVTATGVQSGVATTSFTDGNVIFRKGSDAPNPFTVNYAIHSGTTQNPSNTTCQRTGTPGSVNITNNSGVGVAVSPDQSMKLGAATNLPAGHQFVDYSTQSNGGGTHYASGDCVAGSNSDLTLFANFALDTTPPDTTIDSGPTGLVNSASASFSFSSNETGSTFECKLDTAAYSSCTSPKSYTGLADGSHTFSVRATDLAGNTDTTPARPHLDREHG